MTTALLELTARLVDVASVSHHEKPLADLVEAELAGAGLAPVRIGDNVVARTEQGRTSRVVLAGHLDTVPPAGNERAYLDDDVCRGLGSADMKGGLAVLLSLAKDLPELALDVTLVFYACEEVSRVHSGLLEIAVARPELLVADAAVLLEPTSARVEAGCQGVVRFEVVTGGRRAHSARPWVGVNALHRLAPLLAEVGVFPERRPVIDGCEYRETLQAVGISGGVAANVVPDEAHLALSHRFAPDRDVDEAAASVRALIGPHLDPALGDRIEVLDSSPAAAPNLSHPLLAALVEASGEPPMAKLGWTDVAFFAERGVPAANFGPGDPLLAHTAGEFVTAGDLDAVSATLRRVLASGGSA